MSLLREIQEAATNDTAELATVLCKCRILATRLKHDGLKQWTQYELDGYPMRKDLPKYRVLKCQSFGTFMGAFGRQLRNAPIPTRCIPEGLRETLPTVNFYQGVAALQDLVNNCKSGSLQNRWPADVFELFGGSIFEDMNLMEAWNTIPKSAVVGILDTVRNRVLNFALEIEEENADAGDVISTSPPMSQSKVQQIFKTTIHGNVGNIASGSQHFSQSSAMEIERGNFEQLAEFLKTLGLENKDIKELNAAVKADGEPEKKTFGRKVADWLGQTISKSAQGLLKVGCDVAPKVIVAALHRFYGWPPPAH